MCGAGCLGQTGGSETGRVTEGELVGTGHGGGAGGDGTGQGGGSPSQDGLGTAGSMTQDWGKLVGHSTGTLLRWGSVTPRTPAVPGTPAARRQGAPGQAGLGRAAQGATGQGCRQLPPLAGGQGSSGTRARCREQAGHGQGAASPGRLQAAAAPGRTTRARGRARAGRGQGAALPLKRGAMFQAAMPPFCMNCPRATSRKKMGMPATNTISK